MKTFTYAASKSLPDRMCPARIRIQGKHSNHLFAELQLFLFLPEHLAVLIRNTEITEMNGETYGPNKRRERGK